MHGSWNTAGGKHVQEPSLVQMLRGSIRTAVERFARPATPGSTVSPSDAEGRLPALQIGQIVTAKVLEPLPGGRYIIAVEGTSLEAAGPMGLTMGRELALRVEQLTPALTFRLLSTGRGDDADILQILRTRLPNYVTAADAIQAWRQEWHHLNAQLPSIEAFPHTAKLHDFLAQLLPEGELPGAEQLAAYIRHGGQFYEAMLLQQTAEHPQALRVVAEQDVKGLLLGALQELEVASEQSPIAALMQGVRKHLDHIESQQALRLLANLHGEVFPLQIPVWLGHAFSTILLAVDQDRQGKQDGKNNVSGNYHVLFLLDLDGLGQTQIDARVAAHTLRIVFYLEQQEAIPVLREEIPMLESMLQVLGFPEVLIEAHPLGDRAAEKCQALEIGITIPMGVNLVDVKV